MKLHLLKTWPGAFRGLLANEKKHEVRKADRPFKVGDQVKLREFHPRESVYTGRWVLAVITWITDPGSYGLPKDVCVLSIREIARQVES